MKISITENEAKTLKKMLTELFVYLQEDNKRVALTVISEIEKGLK